MTYRSVGGNRFEITRRLTQLEAGNLLDMSRQNVADIETKALRKITEALANDPGESPLVPFAQRNADQEAAAAFRHKGRARQREATQ